MGSVTKSAASFTLIQEENLLDNLTFDGYVLLNGSLCLDSSGRVLYENPNSAAVGVGVL